MAQNLNYISPEYAPLRQTLGNMGARWNSQNAVSMLSRLMLAKQFPFLLGLQDFGQKNVLGMLGSGLSNQDRFRNEAMGNAEAWGNQARAQGQQFDPADFRSMAMMGANSKLMDWIGGENQRRFGTLQQLQQSSMPWLQMGSPYVTSQKGLMNQLAPVFGATGQAMGQGAFGGMGSGGWQPPPVQWNTPGASGPYSPAW